MKKFLRWLVDFLERKFPDKLVVRESEYNALCCVQTETREKIMALEEKVKALETQVNNINMAIGFSVPKMGVLER